MFTDNEKDTLVSSVADRIRTDLESCAPGDKPDEQDDPKVWIVQRCTQRWVYPNGALAPKDRWGTLETQLEYEDWPGYDTPMTHGEMLWSLEVCEKLFPRHEFRGHRLRPSTSDVGRFPGSSDRPSGEPGIFPKEGDR